MNSKYDKYIPIQTYWHLITLVCLYDFIYKLMPDKSIVQFLLETHWSLHLIFQISNLILCVLIINDALNDLYKFIFKKRINKS